MRAAVAGAALRRRARAAAGVARRARQPAPSAPRRCGRGSQRAPTRARCGARRRGAARRRLGRRAGRAARPAGEPGRRSRRPPGVRLRLRCWPRRSRSAAPLSAAAGPTPPTRRTPRRAGSLQLAAERAERPAGGADRRSRRGASSGPRLRARAQRRERPARGRYGRTARRARAWRRRLAGSAARAADRPVAGDAARAAVGHAAERRAAGCAGATTGAGAQAPAVPEPQGGSSGARHARSGLAGRRARVRRARLAARARQAAGAPPVVTSEAVRGRPTRVAGRAWGCWGRCRRSSCAGVPCRPCRAPSPLRSSDPTARRCARRDRDRSPGRSPRGLCSRNARASRRAACGWRRRRRRA